MPTRHPAPITPGPDDTTAKPREGPASAPGTPAPGTVAPITPEAIAAALASHPTRTAAAASLGVDLSSLRRTARRLGLPWPASARAPGCAGGRWGSALRRESSRQWMRDHRARRREALAAAASGTITVPAPPPVASHPRPKRKA